MATRFIKDTIWTSPNLNEVSQLAELHFYRLLPLPDDHGCCEITSLIIKGRCYPRRPTVTTSMIEKWTKELVEADLIRVWEEKGRVYAWFPTWAEHQRIRSLNKRKTPPPPTNVVNCRPTLPAVSGPEVYSNSTIGGEGREEKEERRGSAEGETKPLKPWEEIFDYWKAERGHPKAILSSERKEAIQDRLAENYSVERIKQAIRGIKRSEHHMGKNDRNMVYDDIELICRYGSNVDQLADLEEKLIQKVATAPPSPLLPLLTPEQYTASMAARNAAKAEMESRKRPHDRTN